MRLIAICLIVLIAASNATSLFDKYPLNFSSKRSIMTLLTQVEAKLKSGGPLDAINRMLNEFVTEVTAEQAQHDQLFASQQADCADEISYRENEISQANAAIQQASETLDGCTSQRIRASQDLDVTTRQLSENRNFLGLVEETRRREAHAFETATEVYQQSSRAVDEALLILEEIWSGEASFAQLSRHMNGMLKSATKIRKVHHLAGVMSALSQLASKDLQADEALFERVKTMLTNFRSRIQADYEEAALAEQAAVAAYNEDKARLTALIESLAAQKEGLEAEISELDKCITTQTGIILSATSKRDRNQKLLDDASSLCQAVTEEYESATEARREELDLLRAIRERVEARFSQLSDDVTAIGQQDEFTYENTYSYEQPTFSTSA